MVSCWRETSQLSTDERCWDSWILVLFQLLWWFFTLLALLPPVGFCCNFSCTPSFAFYETPVTHPPFKTSITSSNLSKLSNSNPCRTTAQFLLQMLGTIFCSPTSPLFSYISYSLSNSSLLFHSFFLPWLVCVFLVLNHLPLSSLVSCSSFLLLRTDTCFDLSVSMYSFHFVPSSLTSSKNYGNWVSLHHFLWISRCIFGRYICSFLIIFSFPFSSGTVSTKVQYTQQDLHLPTFHQCWIWYRAMNPYFWLPLLPTFWLFLSSLFSSS